MNNIDRTLYCDYPIDYQQYYDLLFLSAFLLIFLFYFFCIKSSVRQRKCLYHHNVFLLARNACK